jgi:catechol-2,3-dioxygenase
VSALRLGHVHVQVRDLPAAMAWFKDVEFEQSLA